MIRLILSDAHQGRGGPAYAVRVEGGGELGRMSEPLFEGARRLLEMGVSGDELVTTRRAGKDFDDWNPVKVGVAARLAVHEEASGGLRFREWRPGGWRPDGKAAAE